MFLRTLLANYVRQTVQQQLMNTVAMAGKNATESDSEGAGGDGDEQAAIPISIVVLFGLGVEAGGLIDITQDVRTSKTPFGTFHSGMLGAKRILIGEVGMGLAPAATATSEVIRRFEPDWVISAGFATGLTDTLRRGAMVMPNRVCSPNLGELEIALSYDPNATPAQRGFHVGRLVTIEEEVRSAEDKRKLGERHDAIVCDMETYSVAKVCQQLKTKFLAARVVSEIQSDELPKDISLAMSQTSLAGKLGATASALVNRLSSVKDLWQIREDSLVSSDRLAKFLTAVISQLPISERPAPTTIDSPASDSPSSVA